MGTDLFGFVERKLGDSWVKVDYDLFPIRNYSVYAFLADVRNYDHCEPISEPRGLPEDSPYLNETYDDGWYMTTRRSDLLEGDYFCRTWLTLKELLAFDYDKVFWNRRVTKKEGNVWNGAALAEEGEGRMISYRDNLGDYYFNTLEDLKKFGEEVRIIIWFG